MPTPAYQAPKISYNPWSRSSSTLDPHSAKSFLKQAEDADFKIDAEEGNASNIAVKTMDAKQGLEMQFGIHNCEQFYQENYVDADGPKERRDRQKPDEKKDDGLEGLEEEAEEEHSHYEHHSSLDREIELGEDAGQDDGDAGRQNVDVYKHVYDPGDEEEVQRGRPGDSGSESISYTGKHAKKESEYACHGVIKAHELGINSIRVFEHNGAVSFVTSSDDMFVKIFSL